jgi:hypothetical protein
MLWTCATERMIFFNNEATRIPTQIVTMNDHFSEAVLKNGCTVEFDSWLSLAFGVESTSEVQEPQQTSRVEVRTLVALQ